MKTWGLWNANLMQLGNFIDVFLARHVSGTYAHHQEHYMLSCSMWFSAPSFLDGWWSWEPLRRLLCTVRMVPCTIRTVHTTYAAALKTNAHSKTRRTTFAPYTWPTHRLSRPPPIQKLDAENHMLQLNIQFSWWWAYVPKTCRVKNTSIKLPSCIKLAFHFISELWKAAVTP